MPSKRILQRFFALLATAGLAAILFCACSPAQVDEAPPAPEPEPLVITEVDLADLLSRGLPVILNFGDDSQESAETLATLEMVYSSLGESVIVRSVDLAQNPAAKEGFPAPIIPSQFFYTADGTPIALPLGIGVVLSTLLSVDTQEPVFTVHEGPLSLPDMLIILSFMGLELG